MTILSTTALMMWVGRCKAWQRKQSTSTYTITTKQLLDGFHGKDIATTNDKVSTHQNLVAIVEMPKTM